MPNTPKPLQAGHRERLRKKFMTAGIDSLLDHEVLELLLTYSIPRKDTKPIAWKLLENFGSLSNVLDATPTELKNIKGIGEQTAALIPFVRALLKRYTFNEMQSRPSGMTPEAIMNYCRASLSDKKEEFLQILFLSTRHTIIGSKIVSTGHRDKIEVSPRDIIGDALAAMPQGNSVLFFNTEGLTIFSVTTPFPVKELCRIGEDSLAVILNQDGRLWFSRIDTAMRTASVPIELPQGAHDFCRGETENSVCFL